MIVVRPIAADERNLVLSSWVRSGSRSDLARLGDREDYHAWQEAFAKRVLRDGTVLVAEIASSPGELAGWIAYAGVVLHFVYVKQVYRRMGVARRLLESIPRPVARSADTHATKSVKMLTDIHYNPFLAFEGNL